MRYVVLAHREDTEAEPIARALSSRVDAGAVGLIWADELLLGSRLAHRVGDDGTETRIVSAGGQDLDSGELAGLVCRLVQTVPPQFAAAPVADREYAAMECHALLLSWLASLECRLLNPPSPRGLCGPTLGLLEWLQLGSAVGLRARGLRLAPAADEEAPSRWPAFAPSLAIASTAVLDQPGPKIADGDPCLRLEPLGAPSRQVLVVGDRVLGDLGSRDAEACLELSRRVDCPVLGVRLAPSADGSGEIFCGAETLPPLGPRGADAVAELLVGT